MKSIASRIPLILAGIVFLVAAVLVTTSRLEYCGRPDALRPRIAAATAAGMPSPTLAPPQSVVFVQVEADKPDIEIGWAEN